MSSISTPAVDVEAGRLAQRAHVLREIVESEETYVRALSEIIRTYLVPLKFLGLVSHECLLKVFQNVEQIELVHREIQVALKASAEKTADKEGEARDEHVVEVFKTYAERLKLYSEYTAGFEEASEELHRWEVEEPEVAAFLEERKVKNQDGLTLAALLIQPVQRICRYPLLFGEVLKNTLPTDPEYERIREAQDLLENVTQWINEQKRKEFNEQRLHELEAQLQGGELDIAIPGRTVVLEGLYRVAEIASFETLSFVKVIVFNDSMLWARAAKTKSEVFKYEGHLVFDRNTKTERIGLDVVRVQTQDKMRLLQARDSLATEHLHTVMNEAITARAALLSAVHATRTASAKLERDRLKEKVETMERELEAARRLSEMQQRRIASLTQLLQEACVAAGRDLPAEATLPLSVTVGASNGLEEMRSPSLARHGLQVSNVSKMNKLSPSPKMTHMRELTEMVPIVVVTNQDFVSEDPEELSFAFGELLLLSMDLGEYFMGRPFEGEVFPEKKVWGHMISQTVKRGNTHVRSSEAPVVGGDKVNKEKKSGNFLLDVARATLRGSDSIRVKAARSSQDLTAPSPGFRKKAPGGSNRASAAPTTTSEGVVEQAPGVLDHSQEVIVKQGWLRLISGVRRKWKKHYVFLSENNMYYYENERIAGKKPLGMMPLSDLGTVERSKKYDDGFQMPFTEQMWELRGETAEEAGEWIAAVEKVVRERAKTVLTAVLRTSAVFGPKRAFSEAVIKQPSPQVSPPTLVSSTATVPQISSPIAVSLPVPLIVESPKSVIPGPVRQASTTSPYASFLSPSAGAAATLSAPTTPPSPSERSEYDTEEAFDSDVYDL